MRTGAICIDSRGIEVEGQHASGLRPIHRHELDSFSSGQSGERCHGVSQPDNVVHVREHQHPRLGSNLTPVDLHDLVGRKARDVGDRKVESTDGVSLFGGMVVPADAGAIMIHRAE